jgi:hypothetical protein
LSNPARDGDVKPDADIAALARYVGAMIQGMSVQAQDGAEEAELASIAAIAICEVERHCVSSQQANISRR